MCDVEETAEHYGKVLVTFTGSYFWTGYLIFFYNQNQKKSSNKAKHN